MRGSVGLGAARERARGQPRTYVCGARRIFAGYFNFVVEGTAGGGGTSVWTGTSDTLLGPRCGGSDTTTAGGAFVMLGTHESRPSGAKTWRPFAGSGWSVLTSASLRR